MIRKIIGLVIAMAVSLMSIIFFAFPFFIRPLDNFSSYIISFFCKFLDFTKGNICPITKLGAQIIFTIGKGIILIISDIPYIIIFSFGSFCGSLIMSLPIWKVHTRFIGISMSCFSMVLTLFFFFGGSFCGFDVPYKKFFSFYGIIIFLSFYILLFPSTYFSAIFGNYLIKKIFKLRKLGMGSLKRGN